MKKSDKIIEKSKSSRAWCPEGRRGAGPMYQKGDYIIYGSSGVCLVEAVGPMEMDGVIKGKLYYTLRPVYSGSSTIFTPTDNRQIVMRYILTRGEAEGLIETVALMEPVEIVDERKREEIYREILRECDLRVCIRLLKTLYHRQYVRMESGKKVAAVDERYMKMAEDCIFGELAVALNQKKDEVADMLREKISKKVLTTNMR